jgi:hypothetical protein
MIDAIQPVITRVKPGDDEFDIENIRETLKMQFEQEIATQQKDLSNTMTNDEFMDEDELATAETKYNDDHEQ